MNPELFTITNYLIAINVIGFVITAVYAFFGGKKKKSPTYAASAVISLFGGALGVVLAMLLFARKAEKSNMMSWIFSICVLVMQVILFLFLKFGNHENLTFDFVSFFAAHKPLMIYLICINVITFAAFAADKFMAIAHRQRIRIVTLLVLSFLGGVIGGLLGMCIFRHKIRKVYFAVGLPLMFIMHLVLIFYIMNR